ncbi:MAG: 23S rRNA (pseudouridine(1915)-N(3))-methyltransferase RlmH [Bacilli bacterium]|nr:23S rRNA (pseudouridine(1915)-N(3))-methyltransferase RlmH [Bacilli bacterium]MBQ6404657.1 23S rRNA (pseudouridine(1915)-N(3))-methyltransferase RlmH [Bacilli bacterium]
MIKIITVGFIKEKYLQEAIKEYKKRISKYTNLEIIEIKDEGLVEKTKAISLEASKIEKYLNEKDYVITLEIEGEEYSSPEFAEKIRKVLIENSNITFVIGGSYGLADSIKNKANMHLSFSKMTFPHQLFRVILLEQIYRAYKINNNESYHK